MLGNKTLYICFCVLAFCALGVSLAALYTAARICPALTVDITAAPTASDVTGEAPLLSPYETVVVSPSQSFPVTDNPDAGDASCALGDVTAVSASEFTLILKNGQLRALDAGGHVLIESPFDISRLNDKDRESLCSGISCSDISELRRIISDLIS